MAPIRTSARRTRSSSAAPSILEIISSSPEPEIIPAPKPTVPRPRPTPKRITRNATTSSLASPPPSRAPTAEPTTSQTNGTTKPKPRPKPKPKARPIVKKSVNIPAKIIELSDSSDAEIQEVRMVVNGKGKGKARAVVVEDVDAEDEVVGTGKKVDKGKGKAVPKGKGTLVDILDSEYDDDDDEPLFLPDIRDIFNPGSSQRLPSSRRPTSPPIPAPQPEHDAGWDDFYASNDAEAIPIVHNPTRPRSPSPSVERSPSPPPRPVPRATHRPTPRRVQRSQLKKASPLKGRQSLVPHERHRAEDFDFDLDDFEHGLPPVEPLPYPLSSPSTRSAGVEPVFVSSQPKEKGGRKDKGKGKDKGKERRDITQEPTPPSQNPTPPRRSSPPPRPGPSRRHSPTPPPRPGPSNANQNAGRTIDVDDAWAYNIDELDEEQLQAIAIAEEVDLRGGRGALDEEQLNAIKIAANDNGGVDEFGRADDVDEFGFVRGGGWAGGGGGGGDDEMDEEMARAIAVAAEWDAKDREKRERERRTEGVRDEREGGNDPNEHAMNVDPIPERPRHPPPPVIQRRWPSPQREDDVFDNAREPLFIPSSSPPREVHELLSDAPDIPLDILQPNLLDDEIQPPEPPVPEDPTTTAIASILEMIPEVDPDHLLMLVQTHLPTYGANQIVEFIVSHLFENPGYPRVERGKGKGKAKAVEGGSSSAKRKAGGDDEEAAGGVKKPRIDYASADRPFTGGANYRDCAIAALQSAFPLIPLPYLRKKLANSNGLYAPTYLEIRDEEERVERAGGVGRLYKPKKGGGVVAAKGKGKAVGDEVFEEERKWLEVYLESGGIPASASQGAGNAGGEGKAENEEEDDDDEELEDDGTFVECGCCFSTYPFDRMTACPDAHLFCRSCLRRFASNELGSQNCVLKCMHTSGCTSLFPESELRRLLPPKLFQLYSRLKQQKELKEAGIEGLEECPFCDWACVIETSKEVDRLFRCGNEDECGVVSCRMCRKKEHVPKTCKEAEEDKHLGGRVAIEEAMTKALMRSCPKCAKEFIKSDGCNKMTCPNCKQLSCYVCKQAIAGYDHFHQNDPRNPGSSSTNSKCPLWDSVDQRHDQEVKEAYQQALEQYKRDHPDVEVGKDFKIDLPKSPPKQPNALPAGYIDPNALAAGGGWGVFGAVQAVRPVPMHLRVEPLEDAIRDAMIRLERARGAAANAVRSRQRAHAVELELELRVAEAGGGTGQGKRRRGMPSGHYTHAALVGFRQQLSAAATERAAADIRLDDADQAVARVEAQLEELRHQLEQRRHALAQWRGQEQQRNQLLQQQVHLEQVRQAGEEVRAERNAARLQQARALAAERARAARRVPVAAPKRKRK